VPLRFLRRVGVKVSANSPGWTWFFAGDGMKNQDPKCRSFRILTAGLAGRNCQF
jgi:hypothetical protein